MTLKCEDLMPGETHLAPEALRKWAKLPFPYQLQSAYHLSEACPECWATIHSAQLGQPLSHRDPFLRALARIRLQPKFDLSGPSQAIRLLMDEPFRPHDFPLLLLQESIALGLENEGRNPDAGFLVLPMALAEVMGDSTATEAARSELAANVHCAFVDFFILVGDREPAEAALELAKSHGNDRCDRVTQVNVMLAEFLSASSTSLAATNRHSTTLSGSSRLSSSSVPFSKRG